MTYSYSAPLTYGPQPNDLYYESQNYQKPSAAPAAVLGTLAGAGVGAIVGGRKNPFMAKNGEVLDSFAKSAYEKYVNTAKDAGKEAYEGGLNILKKIDVVKTPDELKKLLNENKEAAKEICTELKQTPEEFLGRVTEDNLDKNKKALKERIESANNNRYRDMKNQIEACWNKDKKKFVEVDSVKKEVFKAIEKSTGKNKIIGKYAAIGAAIGGVISFIAAKIFLK